MLILDAAKDWLAVQQDWQAEGADIGFVPTMGALHAGHMALVTASQQRCQRSLVSIFVNPLQFGPAEDLTCYPKPREEDLALLQAQGVDAVFLPAMEDIYPLPAASRFLIQAPDALKNILCGVNRPGHFDGVATVLFRLLQLCRPACLFMGEKDYQQLLITRYMLADFLLDTQLVAVATVREADGLAMSSRNRYLNPEQRLLAGHFAAVLQKTRTALLAGSVPIADVLEQAIKTCNEAGMAVDYLQLRQSNDLSPSLNINRDTAPRLFAAVKIGASRLIDNLALFAESPVNP